MEEIRNFLTFPVRTVKKDIRSRRRGSPADPGVETALLRQGDAKVFADEIADEARGPGENEPPSQRDAAGIWHSHDVKVFGTVLAQSGQKRWIGVAVKLESALESIVHFMSGRSAAW